MRIIGKIVVVILVLLVGIPIIAFFGYMLSARNYDWKSKTSPLPHETITILCSSFDLEKDHPLCAGEEEVYGPDFNNIIWDAFRPYEAFETESSEAATYDEVEEKIGIFKYQCEPVVQEGDGFTYFICNYDLRGDREFPIAIMFTYPDNAVFRIMINMGYDGE